MLTAVLRICTRGAKASSMCIWTAMPHLNPGKYLPYGPDFVAQVIPGNSLSVDSLCGRGQRYRRGAGGAFPPVECRVGIMPGRSQENGPRRRSSAQDDLPGPAQAGVVADDGGDSIDIQLHHQDSNNGPFFLHGRCDECGDLVARRIKFEIGHLGRERRRGADEYLHSRSIF